MERAEFFIYSGSDVKDTYKQIMILKQAVSSLRIAIVEQGKRIRQLEDRMASQGNLNSGGGVK